MQIKHLLQSGLLVPGPPRRRPGPERGAVLVQQHRDHRDGAGSRQEEVAVAERAAGHGRHRHHDEAHRSRGRRTRAATCSGAAASGTLGALPPAPAAVPPGRPGQDSGRVPRSGRPVGRHQRARDGADGQRAPAPPGRAGVLVGPDAAAMEGQVRHHRSVQERHGLRWSTAAASGQAGLDKIAANAGHGLVGHHRRAWRRANTPPA